MPSIIFAKNKTKIVDLNTKIIFDDKMVNKVFLDKTITCKSWNCKRQICPAVIISGFIFKKKNLILVYFVLKQLKMLTKLSLVYLRGARGRLTGKDKKQYKLTS